MELRLLRQFAALIVITIMQLNASPSRAVLVTWTLDGVMFDDGGMATGSFGYDAATNTFNAINITTTLNPSLGLGVTYTMPGPLASPTLFSSFVAVRNYLLAFELSAPMTDAGGTIPLSLSPLGQELELGVVCIDPTPCPARDIIAGSISAPVVPIPAAFPLLLSGLAVLGFVARRRRTAAAASPYVRINAPS